MGKQVFVALFFIAGIPGSMRAAINYRDPIAVVTYVGKSENPGALSGPVQIQLSGRDPLRVYPREKNRKIINFQLSAGEEKVLRLKPDYIWNYVAYQKSSRKDGEPGLLTPISYGRLNQERKLAWYKRGLFGPEDFQLEPLDEEAKSTYKVIVEEKKDRLGRKKYVFHVEKSKR